MDEGPRYLVTAPAEIAHGVGGVKTTGTSLPGNPIVDKAVMAVTGGFLALFIVAHLVGNLKIFLGHGHLDAYGEWLRDVGQPFLPRTVLLWGFRIVLTAAFFLHILAAIRVVRRNRMATGDRQRPAKTGGTPVQRYAAATMPMTGVIVALFLVFHLLDLTWGTANPGFQRGAVERNLIASLDRWPVAVVYSLAVLALGFHLVHGMWSLFSSLGFHGRRIDNVRRVIATALPAVVVLGNLAIPVAILAGWVS